MKKWIIAMVAVGLMLSPISAIAKGGKGKGPDPSEKAYEKANENAKFLRGDDDGAGNKGKHKGKNKEDAFDDGNKKMKEKRERHREKSKKKMKEEKQRTEKRERYKDAEDDKVRETVDALKNKGKSKSRGE